MKTLKIIFAAAVLAQQLPVAADSGIDSVDPEVRKELTALVEAWIDAEVQSDRSALEEILHEDFLSTFASGTTLDRASYIDFIVGLDISPFKVKNESMVVRLQMCVRLLYVQVFCRVRMVQHCLLVVKHRRWLLLH